MYPSCLSDVATKVEEEFLSDAISSIRNAVPIPKDALTDDDLICEACGGPIAPLRAAKGFDCCIDCATHMERHNKAHKRGKHSYNDEF